MNDIGEGMRCTIHHASNIRKIEKIGQSLDLFSQLLPLMDVTFISNGQLTVVPFPFKYLREYIAQINVTYYQEFFENHKTKRQKCKS